MAKKIVLAGACRTAIGKMGGALSNTPAVELGAIVIKEALKRAGVEKDQVDEVIMGCVLQGGLGQNVARQMMLDAGLPVEVPCFTINKVCGSGLRAVELAAQIIKAGDADIVVAGGAENMSSAPYVMPAARWGARMFDAKMTDMMVNDGLWDAFNNYHMGMTAENVAEQWGLTREELDEFSVISQQRAEKAVDSGVFKDEIVPITIKGKKGDTVCDTDEFPRRDTSLEKLGKLKATFKEDGKVTAGNSSGMNDAASGVLLMNEDKAKELGVPIIARVLSVGAVGLDPDYMGLGPIGASRKVLKKAGLTVDDIDLWEMNEAFAAQCLACQRDLGIDIDKLNVNGGGISIGHPVGATGARLVVTLVHELTRRDQKYGIATLCAGGGMGVAVLVEMV